MLSETPCKWLSGLVYSAKFRDPAARDGNEVVGRSSRSAVPFSVMRPFLPREASSKGSAGLEIRFVPHMNLQSTLIANDDFLNNYKIYTSSIYTILTISLLSKSRSFRTW